MASLTNSERETLLRALRLASHAESIPDRNASFFPVAEHLRALEPDVALIVGDRGAGKSALRDALHSPETRLALIQHAPQVRVAKGEVAWKIGWPLGSRGPDSDGWRRLFQQPSVEGSDAIAIWAAYLLRSVDTELVEAERGGIEPVLRTPGVDAIALLEAYRAAGIAPVASLDALDARLAATNRWVFVDYDELDTLVLEDWETMGKATRGLVSFWAAYARRWQRLRPKLFLRTDFYKHQRDVIGADVAKLAGTRVELHWSDRSLYAALLKHVLNLGEGADRPFARYFSKAISTTTSSVLGVIPRLTKTEEAKPFIDRLASEYMGSNRNKGLTWRWMLDHLRDGNGRAVPRSLMWLVTHAAEQEVARSRATGAHLLHHVSIRNALEKVSEEHVRQAEGSELPWLTGLRKRLAPDREAPWTRPDLTRLLRADFEGAWSSRGNLRPPGATPQEVVENLVDLGVIRERPDKRLDVPDLYLAGLGLVRKGGVARA